MERKFVKPLSNMISSGQHASRDKMHFRKWSVRKLRRRPRSCDKIDSTSRNKIATLSSVKEGNRSTSSDDSKHTSIESLSSVDQKTKKIERNSLSSDDSTNMDLKNDSTLYGKILARPRNDTNESNSKTVDNEANVENEHDERLIPEMKDDTIAASNSENSLSIRSEVSLSTEISDAKDTFENKDAETEKQCKVESDVLMFGCDLPKPTIDNSLELSSDQDSTAGEDEEFTDEEDIENLHPEMLLYKAAAAHNLPVMCAALAAGADKLWTNVNDRGRNALHQAIISVSIKTVI